jgi:hypothetical protein
MSKKFPLIMLIFIAGSLLCAQITHSCYDIQYNPEGGSNSPYLDQVVTVQGIVSGISFYSGTSVNSYGFFIADAAGGPWSGLYIYNQTYHPNLGDLVQITGTVNEYYGLTEISQLTTFQVLSQDNPLPEPAEINSGALNNLSSGEQWESVLVKVLNVSVVTEPNNYQEFYVDDGSGVCQIDDQFFGSGHSWSNITLGQVYSEITGIVDYAYNYYAINPRFLSDLVLSGTTATLLIPHQAVSLHSSVTVPVNALGIDLASSYQSYSFNLAFNPNIISYQSVSTEGTISAPGTINASCTNGLLSVSYQSNSVISGQGVLLNLNFYATNTGTTVLALENVFFGNDSIQSLIDGSLTVNSCYNSPGDTLTVIQRPLLNIPEIVIPGETLTITCLAPQNTTNWNAWLKHSNKRINMPISNSQWLNNPNRWELVTTVPSVPIFELYDLEVSASGGISDITENAIQVIPTRKNNYYFVHITDAHLPNRLYYPNAGFETDSTAVEDFRAVMEDINLIHPEFVLFTGDLVNEGELESFANQYWYGWTQKLLSEFDIPVYVTSGNHDIGGWNQTPPPAGSARRNWWKYFGWNWLDSEDPNWLYHTQDYYFTYGNTIFIGLESYDNYDYWRLNIYGTTSFTDQQIAWLNSTLSLFPNYTKVLFHHYDFQDELNLSALGIDLALWGHIHSNNGSISNFPYNLATRSICDGNRAYRMVRVNNNQIIPYNTIYAGATGNNLSIQYFPSNYGVADSIRATIINNQPLTFENAQIKFIMPSGMNGYRVQGGILEQVDRNGVNNVCYVRVSLSANSTTNISIADSGVENIDPLQVPKPLQIKSIYPNPLSLQGNIQLYSEKSLPTLTLQLYNLKGQLAYQQTLQNINKGDNTLAFTLPDSLGNGIYFLRLPEDKNTTQKILILKK